MTSHTQYIEYRADLEDKRTVYIKCRHDAYNPTPYNSCIFHEHEDSARLADLLLMDDCVVEVRIVPLIQTHILIYERNAR